MFRAVARHSRLVRILRFSISAAMVTVTVIILVAAFNPLRLFAGFPIDPRKMSVSGTKVVMESPRVNGFTADLRPYDLAARTATQDITKPKLLELTEVDARGVLKDGQRVTVRSLNGIYDTKSELLKLSDDVVMNSASGYVAYLSEVTVNVASGDILSNSPVEIKLANDGLLNANRLEVTENGAMIRFDGGVEVTLYPGGLRPLSDEAPSSAPAKMPSSTSGSDIKKTDRSSGSKN